MPIDPEDFVNVLGSAGTGAVTGSAFGAPGALIGGALGLGIGAVGAYKQNQAEAEAEEEQAALERELADADQYAFDMMRDVGAANANKRRNLLAESEAGANRAGIIGGGASQYSRDVSRELAEAQGAQMPGIASAVASAIPAHKQQLINAATQKQQLMDMQTSTDYLSGAANMIGQGAKLAGQVKDYQNRQAITSEPTDEELLDKLPGEDDQMDWSQYNDPAAWSRRQQQQGADYAVQQQQAVRPTAPVAPDMSYTRTVGYGGQEAADIMQPPAGPPAVGIAQQATPTSAVVTNVASKSAPDPALVSQLYTTIKQPGVNYIQALEAYRQTYGEPNFDSVEWTEFFRVLPTVMKLDMVDATDF